MLLAWRIMAEPTQFCPQKSKKPFVPPKKAKGLSFDQGPAKNILSRSNALPFDSLYFI